MNDTETAAAPKTPSVEDRLNNIEADISALKAGKPVSGDLLARIHSHLQELFPSRFPKEG